MENDIKLSGLDMLSRLIDLLETPEELRESDWVTDFLNVLPGASLGSFAEQIAYGPDGFPYFGLRIPEPDEEYEAFSLLSVLDFVCDSGVGVCLYDASGKSQWVLSYGDVWNFRELGSLNFAPVKPGDKNASFDSVLIASPSEEYLPTYVRVIMEDYTRSFLGNEHLCAALIMSPVFDDGRALAFNIFPENFEEDVFRDNMLLLKWLLPRNYALTVLPEESSLRESLTPLIKTDK